MRAIVTGGAGFLGSHLTDRLVSEGWQVTVVDDLAAGAHWLNDRALLIPHAVQRAVVSVPVDAVFHVAGKVGPTGVLRHAGHIVQDTVDAATVAASWALASGCPLIDVSTSEVYGDPTGPNSEMTPRVFQPGSSARMEYAIGKLAAETTLLNTPGLDVRIVRPFNIAGPRQSPSGGFVLPRFVQQAIAGGFLTVYQPGTQRRAFTHVEDIVSGMLAVLAHGRRGEAYNLGNPANECSIAELAAEVIARVGSGSISVVDPVMLHGPDFREAADKVPDASKARTDLGWAPQYTREEIIASVVEFEMEAAA